MAVQDQGPGSRHACCRGWARLHLGMRRHPARHPDRRWAAGISNRDRRLYRSIARHRRTVRVLRHVQQRGGRRESGSAARIIWRYEHPQRKFPFYATAAVWNGKVFAGGRDKILHALDAKTGKEAVDVHDQGSHRFVACRHPRRTHLLRIERRHFLCRRWRIPAKKCGSSARAPLSPRRPQWMATASSSVRRTGAFTAWAVRRNALPPFSC